MITIDTERIVKEKSKKGLREGRGGESKKQLTIKLNLIADGTRWKISLHKLTTSLDSSGFIY